MAKGIPTEIKLTLACCALVWDLRQADKHQRTCPRCVGRDYLEIALDVVHLVQAA
jgi:hypothetical protein